MARPAPAWSPALREGVAASRVVVSGGPFVCVADFLAARFPRAPSWAPRLLTGEVMNGLGQTLRADSPCPSGMLIWYWRDPPPEPRVPFEIEVLFQDEQLVVVDKPHFLPVAPSGRFLHETVLVRLKRLLGINTLSPMHRIDLDTAGVVVFTVQPSQRNAYQALLRERRVHKVYEALAPWRADLVLPQTCSHRLQEPPGKSFMQMQVVAGEPNAETRVQVLRRVEPPLCRSSHTPNQALALYQLTPSTGRRHQLRVQMNALGLPIVGDRIYPVLHPELPPGAMPDHSQPLQLLSREFSFIDPLSGQHRSFVSRRQLGLVG
jgi:tRNA pseudouridine32 synthase / 23S rRNA pseudouridine746 synthase